MAFVYTRSALPEIVTLKVTNQAIHGRLIRARLWPQALAEARRIQQTSAASGNVGPAGLGRRGMAAFVDVSVLGCAGVLVMVPVTFVLGYQCFFGGSCTGAGREIVIRAAWYLSTIVLPAAYFLISWTRWGAGKTPGMRAAGIRVIGPSGRPLDLGRALARLFVLALVLVPGVFWQFSEFKWLASTLGQVQLVGVLALLATVLVRKDRRGIHDLAAGATVVEDQERS